MVDPENAEEQTGRYTAVVHFHGMGSQRRLEETSRLIDALDRYQYAEFKANRPIGILQDIKPRLTPSDPEGNEPDAYVRAEHLPPWPKGTSQEDRHKKLHNLRFHEAYWAPVMAEEKSAISIVVWLLGQWRRPFQTLLTPWRQRQRLRRASLFDLFENYSHKLPEKHEDTDLASLVEIYNKFESPASRDGERRRSFSDFLAYIRKVTVEDKQRSEADRCTRLQSVAKAWRHHYVSTEIKTIFLLTTAVLVLALSAGAVLAGAFLAADAVVGVGQLVPALAPVIALLGEPGSIAMMLVGGLVSLTGTGRFLTDALGDVRAWASYLETDVGNRKRQEILSSARRTMIRVLTDGKCNRVVVTAHSLGTTIAHDTLLSLTRMNRAHNPENPIEKPIPLEKIEHFITWGSPIDKIEYFFESSTSDSHRYLRVREDLRGDTGSAPFAKNRHRYIHWINFWDDGDPVSGPLSSPMPASRSLNPVDNFHVKGFAFPFPGASHTRYLSHRPIVAYLWDVIINRVGSYAALENRGPNGSDGKDYDSVLIRPGKGRGDRRSLQYLALGLPWVVALTIALAVFAGIPPRYGFSVCGVIVLLLGISAYYSKLEGPLQSY